MREGVVSSLDEIDFFSDPSLLPDPHPFFDHLRGKGPVVRIPPYDVVAVTGYDEGLAVFRDDENFSTVNASCGPLPPLPFTPEGDDITDQIEAHRHLIPGGQQIMTTDPPNHARMKSLLMGMITPKRLKENEAFLWRLADQRIDGFIDRGAAEVVGEFARPFAVMAIADLLGVPHEDFHRVDRQRGTITKLGVGGAGTANPFAMVEGVFTEYIEDRRLAPRQDVLSELANIRYADGATPAVKDVVAVASSLFAAGEDTTMRVITAALRILAEDPQMQAKVRADRSLVPEFVEETLRLQGTVRSDFRLVKKPTRIGEIEVRPGQVVMLLIGALNRDARRFEDPHQFRLGRKNLRDHLAFGRGIHTCAGAPLARAEVKVALERFFDRTRDFQIDASQHGQAGERRYEYIPSYLLQGLNTLHLTFAKA
jgi:cytochrome P450